MAVIGDSLCRYEAAGGTFVSVGSGASTFAGEKFCVRDLRVTLKCHLRVGYIFREIMIEWWPSSCVTL
jgi:hypothetical protein